MKYDDYNRKLNRFMSLCLQMAEVNDRQAERNEENCGVCDGELNKVLGLGYLAFSDYLREGVKEIIALQGQVSDLRSKVRLAKIGEENAQDFLEEIFGDRDIDNINAKDKERIKALVKQIEAEWDARIAEEEAKEKGGKGK